MQRFFECCRLPVPLLAAGVLVAVLFCPSRAGADFSTPFVESNNNVGDVSKSRGYIVATGIPSETAHFLVIVTTDTLQHITIRATAKKGVVPESALGRPAIIEAKIVERREAKETKRVTVTLEILSAVRVPRDDAIEGTVAADPRFALISKAQDVPAFPFGEIWDKVENWPADTTLQAHDYDYYRAIKSTRELKKGIEGLLARGKTAIAVGKSPYGQPQGVLYHWRADGSLAERAYHFKDQLGHVTYQYYPNGKLWAFMRYDRVKEHHQYFDKNGELLAYSMNFFKKARKHHTMYIWNNQIVDEKAFRQFMRSTSPFLQKDG